MDIDKNFEIKLRYKGSRTTHTRQTSRQSFHPEACSQLPTWEDVADLGKAQLCSIGNIVAN